MIGSHILRDFTRTSSCKKVNSSMITKLNNLCLFAVVIFVSFLVVVVFKKKKELFVFLCGVSKALGEHFLFNQFSALFTAQDVDPTCTDLYQSS